MKGDRKVEEVEADWLLALIDYSSGYDKEKARIALLNAWLELGKYEEWRGAVLLESRELARRIAKKHPEWGTVSKAYC